MNKATRILLAAGLILAVATPALAEFKLNGYYRLMGISSEVRSGGAVTQGSGAASASKEEDGDVNTLIDQRFRAKLTYTLNENVSLVYFAEVDSPWGQSTTGTKALGGGVGADSINVETKNVYLDLKYGDTAVVLGVQAVNDPFEGIIFFDDMAGAYATHKMGNTSFNLLYSKWREDTVNDWDDTDFYGAGVQQKFNDNFKAGAAVYYADYNDATDDGAFVGFLNHVANAVPDDRADFEAFYYGLTADARFGVFGLDGFVVLQDGEVSVKDGGSVDTQALSASVKGRMKLENGDVGLRVIYFSEQDDNEDDYQAWIGNQGQYEFANENLMQFLVDKFVCNYGKERYAIREAAEAGAGLLGFVLSGNHKLPSDMYLNWGAGYFRAIEDSVIAIDAVTGDFILRDREGKTLGYEVAARIGKKYFDKVDVSLNASYASFGDFYDNTAVKNNVANAGDPDATYKAYLMVNVPF